MKYLFVIAFFALIALGIYYIANASMDCASRGGTLVRPAFGPGFTCVEER